MKKVFTSIAALLLLSVSHAQTPAELRAMLPEADGWEISETVEVFQPDNLFDRINGAAPLFIENNFRELSSLEYTRGEEYITIQAYRHATPVDAFGMYASERSPDLQFFPFAGEAHGDAENIFFFAGDIYVKMWSSAADTVTHTLLTIAEGFAKNIDPKAGYPPVILAYPAQDKVPHTEAYITSSYIGHEFLRSVYTTDYVKEGKPFQLFVVDGGTKEGAQEILAKYLAFTKQAVEPAEGNLTIADRYNGEIPVLWKGQYIVGIFYPDGDPIPGSDIYINMLAANL